MSDPIDLLQATDNILSRNLSWVAAADAKVPSIMAIDTAMLGVLAALAPAASFWSPLNAVVAAGASVLLLASLGCLAGTVFPRLHGPKRSLIYFGGIVGLDRENYIAELQKATKQQLAEDFARQCYRNAEIANRKFTLVRWAMVTLFIAILPWLVAVSLLYSSRPSIGPVGGA